MAGRCPEWDWPEWDWVNGPAAANHIENMGTFADTEGDSYLPSRDRFMPTLFRLLTVAVIVWLVNSTSRAEVVSFRNDVMPVLSKAGCNLGTCHGNQNGKGGFKLSLRGQDPRFDFNSLTRLQSGRRINRLQPASSLMLLKPTMQIAHQGGQRFAKESQEYRILFDWINAGALPPRDDAPRVERLQVVPSEAVVFGEKAEVPLSVTAFFDDGSERDVTRLAVYEPSTLSVQVTPDGVVQRQDDGEATVVVRFLNQQVPVSVAFLPENAGFKWFAPPARNYIDDHVFAKLQRLHVNPSAIAEDNVFVRRAYMDALGILPTAEESRSFVADSHGDKRERLVEQLLMREEFADHWALKWSDILRNEEKVLDPTGVAAFHDWIQQSMAEGLPLNEFVAQLVSARGSTYKNPPANYYRANRDPLTRGETTARLFLGYRLQCAKCHNHPFDRWTQDDYYSWSAVFARIDYKIIDNKRRDKLDKHEFQGEQIVLFQSAGEIENARTGGQASPKLLGGDQLSTDGDRIHEMAQWLTSSGNEQFAKVLANMIWFHVMGRGLVEPIDDFRVTNPASHPALLDELAADLTAHDFDLRHLVRRIMTSATYQLSAESNSTNAGDLNFSRALVERYRAEQILDAQSQVLDLPVEFNGYELGLRAGQIPGVQKVSLRDKKPSDGDRFLMAFGKPERLLACECERSNETTLAHAFLLTSGKAINERLNDSRNRLFQLAGTDRPSDEVITELYWIALSRDPTAVELQAAAKFLAADRLAGLQDLAWALLNSKEFLFRH